jgi:hypothetical protein
MKNFFASFWAVLVGIYSNLRSMVMVFSHVTPKRSPTCHRATAGASC